MARDRLTKVMFVCRQAPYGSVYAYEGLGVMLIFAAYEQEYAAAFVDDRGLTADDLMIPVEVVDRDAIAKVMAEQDVILPF